MKVIRIRKPSNEFVELIGPKLSFMGVPRKEQCLQIVLTLLEEFPENVLVLAALEDETPLGFLIANVGVDNESVLVLQLWLSIESVNNDLAGQLLGFLRKWTESGKRRFIRIMTSDPTRYESLEFKTEAFQMLLKLDKEDEILFDEEGDSNDSSKTNGAKQTNDTPADFVELPETSPEQRGDLGMAQPHDGDKSGEASGSCGA